MSNNQVRHILNLSGGKDSSALAIYMRDRVPEMEYLFCDTQKELPETYEYLDRLEAYLGRTIVRLNADRGFDHWLEVFGGYLPSPNMRWCTRHLKLIPFEKYVGEDTVYSYIGIRADEDRVGYISRKPNIIPTFPFKKEGIKKEDVYQILNEAGLGLPKYYEWRTRSGCYFCFFQRKAEWIGLLENHPELFELSKKYEKLDVEDHRRFTWSRGESLEELQKRKEQILRNHQIAIKRECALQINKPLTEVFEILLNNENDEQACLICRL